MIQVQIFKIVQQLRFLFGMSKLVSLLRRVNHFSDFYIHFSVELLWEEIPQKCKIQPEKCQQVVTDLKKPVYVQ
jgi:hypothetical protein